MLWLWKWLSCRITLLSAASLYIVDNICIRDHWLVNLRVWRFICPSGRFLSSGTRSKQQDFCHFVKLQILGVTSVKVTVVWVDLAVLSGRYRRFRGAGTYRRFTGAYSSLWWRCGIPEGSHLSMLLYFEAAVWEYRAGDSSGVFRCLVYRQLLCMTWET